MDRGAWWAAVNGVATSRIRLSDFTFTFHFHALEKEMGRLQCSCLENPRDGGAWWAAVYGVAQSWTQLKWLSSSVGVWEIGGFGNFAYKIVNLRKSKYLVIWVKTFLLIFKNPNILSQGSLLWPICHHPVGDALDVQTTLSRYFPSYWSVVLERDFSLLG